MNTAETAMGEVRAQSEKSVLASRPDWQRVSTAMTLCVLILILYVALVTGAAFAVGRDEVICFNLMNFRGAVGIPFSIIASLCVVTLLGAGVGGEFKLKVWKLTLEGPTVPITMWVACFVSMAVALHQLLPVGGSTDALPPVLARLCQAT